MDALWVEFSSGQLLGGGHDIVGAFTLTGSMHPNGTVRIVKQYHAKHHLVYFGQYDGEGLFFGTWALELFTGNWSIKLLHGTSDQIEEFEEIMG